MSGGDPHVDGAVDEKLIVALLYDRFSLRLPRKAVSIARFCMSRAERVVRYLHVFAMFRVEWENAESYGRISGRAKGSPP